MSDKSENLTPGDLELESALRSLRVSPVALDRDRLMFEAGQRQGRRSLLMWRAAAAVLAAGIGLSLMYRPAPPSQTWTPADERYQHGSLLTASSAGPANVPGRDSYFRLREWAFGAEIEALAAPVRDHVPEHRPPGRPTTIPRGVLGGWHDVDQF